MTTVEESLFLRACKRLFVERTPIWMMRQAGRYLPEYRAIREKYDFQTMYRTPELATEITLQPVRRLEVDAAILFSDILVVPEAMGLAVEFVEGKGPIFRKTVQTAEQINDLNVPDMEESLGYVLEAIRMIKAELNSAIPLIGFSGAPWTLFCYMVEGRGSKDFATARRFLFEQPGLAESLLEKITAAVTAYLSAQIAAGADAVQIFDSWAGVLAPHHYRRYSLKYIRKVIEGLRRDGQPVIVFCRGAHHSLAALVECGADVLGIDWTVDFAAAKRQVQGRVALQGNLDPAILLAGPEVIREETLAILRAAGRDPGHIFNLGHGILPTTRPDHARYLVDLVHEESQKIRAS